jgi:glycosyltransferase involved in cell wall biosynthesis
MEKPFPVVSVIIPTYNQAELLKKAIRSIKDQTFQDWEAIVIDNFSVDNTREIVEDFQDSRIHYMQFRNHGIIAASRNRGISQAAGQYIAFLDSDDLWYPEKLSRSLEYLFEGADAICHGMRICQEGKADLEFKPHKPDNDLFDTLLYEGNSIITTSTVVVKKDWLVRYPAFSEDIKIVTAEDYDLWLRLLKNGIHWKVISDILGEYTIHGKNESKNIERQMDAEERVVRMNFKENRCSSFTYQLRIRKRRMMVAFRAGKRSFESGYWVKSVPYLIKGIKNILK